MIIAAARRRGVTLVEVLIAIFLMGIGLMAILSLFPLGAAQMAQAIKDQRAAEAATNASALARVAWKIACDDDLNNGAGKFYGLGLPPTFVRGGTYPASNQPFVMALDDPSYRYPGLPVPDFGANNPLVPDPYLPTGPNANQNQNAMPTIPRTGYMGASYPVFVDPIGWRSNAANGPARQWWLPTQQITTNGGARIWRIPRRTLYHRDTTATIVPQPWIEIGMGSNPNTGGTLPASIERLYKQFSLMDDMAFNFDGRPDLDANQSTSPGSGEPNTAPFNKPIDPQRKYTWAFLYRRPGGANRSLVDISVIVYSGRSIDVPSAETAYPAYGQFGTKTLVLNYAPPNLPKPAVRRGQWILDATLSDIAGGLDPQGRFYRVVNVDDSVANQVTLELQTALLGGPFDTTNPTRPLRTVIVMDNVVEVFTRTDVTAVSPPLPY